MLFFFEDCSSPSVYRIKKRLNKERTYGLPPNSNEDKKEALPVKNASMSLFYFRCVLKRVQLDRDQMTDSVGLKLWYP
ncbi:hypothetical protein TNCT_546041 [Trichonephila clavata]|uniref:Uncharacterized protein n=1 Tax=Trichonephila clavata TaxID=2740835 RepID=A0A8X6GUL6_TRICU|nr:hypothetical protein TNCT_546041 [Trichonephila clavata]